jgi:hypothetical protein
VFASFFFSSSLEETYLNSWILVVFELFQSFTRFFVIEQLLMLVSEENHLFSKFSIAVLKIYMRALSLGVLPLKYVTIKLRNAINSENNVIY